MSKKELTIDYRLYKDELRAQYCSGYDKALIDFTNHFKKSNVSKKELDIFLSVLSDYLVENEDDELSKKIFKV